jgi:hypothetical protein
MTTAQAENDWLFITGGNPNLTDTRLSFFYDPTTILVPNKDTRQVVILAEYIGGMQSLGSSFKCNTSGPLGIGCCDGQTKQAPQ